MLKERAGAISRRRSDIPSDPFRSVQGHLGANAAPVARHGVEDEFQLPSAHARLTSLLLGLVGPAVGASRAARVLGARATPLVRDDLVREQAHAGTHAAGNAVGVAAGAPPLHQGAGFQYSVEVSSPPSAVGQPVHRFRHFGQAVHARAALAGTLPFHVPHDIRHLGQRANTTRQGHDHAGTECRAAFASAFSETGRSRKRSTETQAPP